MQHFSLFSYFAKNNKTVQDLSNDFVFGEKNNFPNYFCFNAGFPLAFTPGMVYRTYVHG
jgi:hypothetical protein